MTRQEALVRLIDRFRIGAERKCEDCDPGAGSTYRYMPNKTDVAVIEAIMGRKVADGELALICGDSIRKYFYPLRPLREQIYAKLALAEVPAPPTDLRELKPGWNSHNAPAIDERAIMVAEAILGTPGTAVPRSNGGVQIEWHVAGVDIEIGIKPDGSIGECEVQNTELRQDSDQAKQWLDAIATAIYPHKGTRFAYHGPFMVEEIEKLRRRLGE